MSEIDKMARELLAAELARDGWAGELAAALINDRPDDARVPGNMALAAIRAALLAAPPGWKLVPVEPTPEMRDAGEESASVWQDAWECGNVYRAMLAAAPEPK